MGQLGKFEFRPYIRWCFFFNIKFGQFDNCGMTMQENIFDLRRWVKYQIIQKFYAHSYTHRVRQERETERDREIGRQMKQNGNNGLV